MAKRNHLCNFGNGHYEEHSCEIILFDLILYVPVENLSVTLGQSSWVEPVLRRD